MVWIPFRKSNIVKPSWSYTTSGSLWRILPSSHYFVGEDRDTSTKHVSFFCLDRRTGNVFWQHKSFDEQWWIGLEAIHGDMLFLHRYASPDMPEHQGILAIDIRSGSILWKNDDMRFLLASGDAVCSCKHGFEKISFYLLERENGKLRREIDPDEMQAFNRSAENEPAIVELPAPAGESVQKMLEHTLQQSGKPIHGILQTECLHRDPYLLSSFYESMSADVSAPSFRQHFVIVSPGQSALYYHEVVTTDTRSPVGDAFFCIEDSVYFIGEKKRLTAINLSNIIGG